MVFDAPGMKKAPFKERYKKFKQICEESKSPYLVALDH